MSGVKERYIVCDNELQYDGDSSCYIGSIIEHKLLTLYVFVLNENTVESCDLLPTHALFFLFVT